MEGERMDESQVLQRGDVDFSLSWVYGETDDPESGYFKVSYIPIYSKSGEPVLSRFNPYAHVPSKDLPQKIRGRLQLMQQMLLQKIPHREPKDLGFGPRKPRKQVREMDYKYYLVNVLVHAKCYYWYDGINEEVDLTWKADGLTEAEKVLFSSLDDYAWDVAYEDYKGRVGNVDATRRSAFSKILVFISHRGDTVEFAKKLCDRIDADPVALFQCYVRPFLDENAIPGGGEWVIEVEDALERCVSFIPIITPLYRQGPVAYREYEVAINMEMRGKISLVPALLRGSEDDIPTLSGPLSYVDFRRYDRTKDEGDFEKELPRVIHGILRAPMKAG